MVNGLLIQYLGSNIMAVINFPNSPRSSQGGIDGNLALDNQFSPESEQQSNIGRNSSLGNQLSATGQLNQRPEYRQNEDFGSGDMGPIGQKNREARIAQDQEEKNKNTESQKEEDTKAKEKSKITPAQKRARLITYGMYKFSWSYLLPSRGLTWFYLLFHWCAKYMAGGENFCHFVQITNPVLAMEEIGQGKDTRDDKMNASFWSITVLIVLTFAFLAFIIFWLIHFMQNPTDVFKALIGLAKDAIKELWEFFKSSMTGPDNVSPSNWDSEFK